VSSELFPKNCAIMVGAYVLWIFSRRTCCMECAPTGVRKCALAELSTHYTETVKQPRRHLSSQNVDQFAATFSTDKSPRGCFLTHTVHHRIISLG